MNLAQPIFDLPAILFPHCYLPESILKRVLSLFRPLTMFQPWFMARPVFVPEQDKAESIQIIHPPDNLKPGEDFRGRLSEYRHWIENNLDKGYTESLMLSQESDLSENTTWEIRQMIRGMRGQTSKSREALNLKWHLILHLAQDMEDQKREADSVLKIVKERDVPLKGILEESEDVEGLAEDLPPFDSDPLGNEYHLRQIFQAWFGLFGEYLEGNEILVTTDWHVMDYVTELWKEYRLDDPLEDPPFVRFIFPDLSHDPLKDLAEIRHRLLNNEKIRELKLLIRDVGENPTRSISRMKTLSKEVEAVCSEELSAGSLNMTVKYIAPPRHDEQGRRDEVLKPLSKKTIVLVEKGS